MKYPEFDADDREILILQSTYMYVRANFRCNFPRTANPKHRYTYETREEAERHGSTIRTATTRELLRSKLKYNNPYTH